MKIKIVSPNGWMGFPKGSIVDLDEMNKKKQKKQKKAPKNKMVKKTKNK